MSASLHTDILTPGARAQFEKLKYFCDEFYLAGGTALALQIDHRISVDYDFFSADPIKKTLVAKIEEIFSGATITVLLNNARELTVMIDGVKYTFLHYPFPLVLSLVEAVEGLKLLSIKEILATKAYSIGRRGSIKDYVDIYIGLKERHATLSEIIHLASQKYSEAFNDRLFLEQLLFLDDVEELALSMRQGANPPRHALVDFFTQAIKELTKEKTDTIH